jgi:hypothetical protein
MMAAVDRRMILWTLVVFFGASLAFNAIQDLTRDEPLGVTLGLEAIALVAIVGALVVITRRRG